MVITPAPAGPPPGSLSKRISTAVDRLVARVARHWLGLFNTIVAVFIGLPFLAPVLMHLGGTGGCAACSWAGHLLYVLYSPTCHQLPERSYFLFGPQVVYSTHELETAGAVPPGISLLQRELLRYPGSEQLGYKVAVCERDVAIYGGILIGGLIFGLIRSMLKPRGRPIDTVHFPVPRLRLWTYALLLIPMAVDGVTQLFGFRESTWFLRTVTGLIFGLASVWLAYPYIQEAMDDIVRTAGRSKQREGQTGQNVDPGV